MIDKKILIGIGIAVILIIGVIGFFIFGMKSGTVGGTTIDSLFLESFPAGTQMGPGLTGTETTTIKIGEIVSLSGTITVDGSITTSVQVFDTGGNLLLGQPCGTIKSSGGFGCGFGYPQVAGTYTLKFYVDDVEKTSFEFEVTQ